MSVGDTALPALGVQQATVGGIQSHDNCVGNSDALPHTVVSECAVSDRVRINTEFVTNSDVCEAIAYEQTMFEQLALRGKSGCTLRKFVFWPQGQHCSVL